MSLTSTQHEQLAAVLHMAATTKTPCDKVTEMAPSLELDDAYAIQRLNIAARCEEGLFGEPAKVIGYKVGLTSHAIQSWLKVDQPDFGHLLSDMVVGDGAKAPIEKMLQPRIEGELAFVLRHDLHGPGLTAADVLRATDFVVPALEIIDSRIAEWGITYFDTIADNASSGFFVLGTAVRSPHDLDFRLMGMSMAKNGRTVSSGAGAACMDNPVNAVVWLANTLGRWGQPLEAGQVILSGALGPVSPVTAGDFFELKLAHVGGCSVRF